MSFNKSEQQKIFNELKGELIEINFGEKYSNITIKVGHNNFRKVNFVAKTDYLKEIILAFSLNDKITVKFYISSVFKYERYHTTATLLEIEKC